MRVIRVVSAGTSHPFGDERSVNEAFPTRSIPQAEADPFLLAHQFSMESEGVAQHEDDFPIDWHPHRGFDICSYFKTGIGRHGDSLGNRETFATPGMQWVSCGSGVEHAEGGATPEGQAMSGFQLWINVPSAVKMADPRYGTHPTTDLPLIELAPGVTARLLAGKLDDEPEEATAPAARRGPFETAAKVTLVDFELAPGASVNHSVPRGLRTALLYVYEGEGTVNGAAAGTQTVVQLDARAAERGLELAGGVAGLSAMLFAGEPLGEPIASHGPIVMNTQQEIAQCFDELRAGRFPPVRVPWDYKREAARPKE